jgi:hypothetical protein
MRRFIAEALVDAASLVAIFPVLLRREPDA